MIATGGINIVAGLAITFFSYATTAKFFAGISGFKLFDDYFKIRGVGADKADIIYFIGVANSKNGYYLCSDFGGGLFSMIVGIISISEDAAGIGSDYFGFGSGNYVFSNGGFGFYIWSGSGNTFGGNCGNFTTSVS